MLMELSAQTIPIGNLCALGSVDMTLKGIDTQQKLNLEVRIEGCDAVNDWDFWVYPAQVELIQEQYIPPTPWTKKHFRTERRRKCADYGCRKDTIRKRS